MPTSPLATAFRYLHEAIDVTTSGAHLPGLGEVITRAHQAGWAYLCLDTHPDPHPPAPEPRPGDRPRPVVFRHTHHHHRRHHPQVLTDPSGFDDLRRGKPSNHKVFGEGMALLAGDALLAYSLEFILATTEGVGPERLLRVVDTLVQVVGASGLTGGQALGFESQGRDDIDVTQLELMHSRKTASLIQASVVTGGILAGASEDDLRWLTSYAGKVGLAFQIVDDVLEETGTDAQLGKPSGSDRSSGKVTFPRLLGVDKAMVRVRQLVEEAKRDLDPYGARALPLLLMADYTIARTS